VKGAGLRRLQLTTSWGPLLVAGGSRAGEGTLILLPQLQLALDVGRAHRGLPPMTTVLVSHGHMDHVGGVGYWASQRHLQAMGPARLVVPREIAADIELLLATHARLEGAATGYAVEVVSAASGDVLEMRRDMVVEFFATDHWVPTLGSRLVWRRQHLLPELVGLPGEEIARRRRAGEDVTCVSDTELLAYCADSGPGVLAEDSPALSSEVVLLECSFFKAGDRQRAARFGHLHLEDLLERLPRLRCRHLVLLHASRRHRLREVEAILDERLRPRLDASLHHLMVDWD
jgi:ribonuclease Z